MRLSGLCKETKYNTIASQCTNEFLHLSRSVHDESIVYYLQHSDEHLRSTLENWKSQKYRRTEPGQNKSFLKKETRRGGMNN